MAGHILKVAPAAEPLSLDEVKGNLRLAGVTSEDDLLASMIASAREHVEKVCALALLEQTWTLRLDTWAHVIELPMVPAASVAAVRYLDGDGVLTTLAPDQYTASLDAAVPHKGTIRPAYGEVWPTAWEHVDAIEIEYIAGFGVQAADVPTNIRRAMHMMVGSFYEAREEFTTGTIVTPYPRGADDLLAPYRALPI